MPYVISQQLTLALTRCIMHAQCACYHGQNNAGTAGHSGVCARASVLRAGEVLGGEMFIYIR